MADGLPDAFSQTFTVRYDECGADGALRASVYLRFIQELAFGHSAALGFPLTWYERHRRYWLVRRVHLAVAAPAGYGEALVGTTRILGARRMLARRLNTIRRVHDGTEVATALVDWTFTADGSAPAHVPEEMARAFPTLGQPIAPMPLEEPPRPAGDAWTALWIRSSDLDAMGHANNAVYLDLLDDAVTRAGGRAVVEAHPRTYDIQYRAAAGPGMALRDLAWEDDGTWHYRLETSEDRLLLHGRVARTGGPA